MLIARRKQLRPPPEGVLATSPGAAGPSRPFPAAALALALALTLAAAILLLLAGSSLVHGSGGGAAGRLALGNMEVAPANSTAAGGGGGGGECEVHRGRWVYDEAERPLYKEEECVFLTEQVTCMRNGRKDAAYQRWRWQPDDCSLPRFEAKPLLEKLRNKRMMFVGDSLNRNQWESMVCLVQSAVEWNRKTLVKNGSLNVFRIEDYNMTVEFYWAPFLVESNSDDPNMHSIRDRIISPTSISKHAANWKGVHYLIFNTYIWWMNTPKMKVLRGSFTGRTLKFDEVDRIVAYRKVLRAWASWVDQHVDPANTMVFFMSISPVHLQSQGWGVQSSVKCAMETQPINLTTSPPPELGTDWRLFDISRATLRSMSVPVRFINITALSELRKDAHTSVHTLRQGKLLTAEQQADPATYADCIHWCLPGVPDVWNEFIYAKIMDEHRR